MNVGFIGLGNMGRPMATNLAKAGHQLVVHDIREEAAQALVGLGARWAPSAKAVAGASEVVFTSLPTPRHVEDVALGRDGVLAGTHKDTVYVDLSTISPTVARRLYAVFKERGIPMLDAPVSGGTSGAATRNLSVLVGGDEAVYQRVKPVLDAIGDKVMYCGPSGAGCICKIANNLISMSVAVVLGEAFTLGVKAGVDPMTLYEAISRSSGDTRRMRRFPTQLFKRDFEPGFFLELALKDVRLALELAREYDLPMEMAALVEQKYAEGRGRGWGRLNSDAVIRLQEERAGVELKSEGGQRQP
ncbi:MAG: NAD(P)-dependent oxidoreductase [Chloroflexi bacterium]|nr:NAD(P)-dependent oxidoreductase [Chloroflexota bacterium]